MEKAIKWLCDGDYLRFGKKIYVDWQYQHTLIYGKSGAGKTAALSLLLAKISKYDHSTRMILLDFKSEFLQIKGNTGYYTYSDGKTCMTAFDEIFNKRLSGEDLTKHRILFVIDEWGAFISSCEKKQAEDYKKMLNTWLMLSRSLNITIIVGIQRCDQIYFYGSTRDQFDCCVGLSNLSKEGIAMMFSEYKDLIKPIYMQGEGYMLQGGFFYHIQVPHISNFEAIYKSVGEIII